MPELKERFSLADEALGTPDLWAEARRRAAAPDERPRGRRSDAVWSPDRHRLVTAAVAFAVFAAAAVFAWDLSHPDLTPSPEPGVDLGSELPEGWSELPAPPENRSGAATAWTGSELIVWGGYVYEVGFGEGPLSHEGSVFDAASRRWEPMAGGPLSARSAAASAWTGEEFLVWGGRSRETCCRPSDTELFLNDGAAYDPSARTWRRLPDAPIEARAPLSVWTGEEMIVWGSRDRFLRYRDGAAYDPRSNTWRRIADGPIDLTDAVAVWSGEEMFVFGAALHGGNVPETETAIGAAYDPATDSWRGLPPSLDSNTNANTAVWADERLIALDYDSDAETYEPSTGHWRTLDPMPLDDGEDIPDAAYIEGWVLTRFFRGVAGFSTDTERWFDLTDDLAEEAPGALLFGPPIAAGSAFLVFAIGPGGRSRLLAYRPPGGNEEKATQFVPDVTQDGDIARMPITFPNGAGATLVYPTHLDLEELGVAPSAGYVFENEPSSAFPIYFLYGTSVPIDHFVEGDRPVAVLGEAEVWRNRIGDRARPFYIRTRLSSWTVLISLGSADDAGSVLSSLSFEETATGFPVVHAGDGLSVAERRKTENTGPPILRIGGEEAASTDAADRAILLSPEGCGGVVDQISSDGREASLCLDGNVLASVVGDPSFVEDAFRTLRIEDFVSEPFVPDATVSEGVARVPVTFPDGAQAVLSYRVTLSLAELGVQPDVSYVYREHGSRRFPIVFLHGPDGSIDSFVDSEGGSRLINTSEGGIEVLRANGSDTERRFWIRYELPSWTVLVSVQDALGSAATVAGAIDLRQTPAGFPVVEVSGPIGLAEGFGEAGGAQLAFGDGSADPDTVSQLDSTVFLSPDGCTPATNSEWSGGYGSACLGDGNVFASIYGDREFASSVIEDLRVEDFREA